MPFLIVPQTLIFADSYELKTLAVKEAKSYQENILKEMSNVDLSSRKVITKGGFKSVDYYSWTAPVDAYLVTAFVFPKFKNFKTEQKERYLKVSTLIRQEDCVHLSSSWEKSGDKNFFAEIGENKKNLQEGVTQKFNEVSTLKLENTFATRGQEKDEFIYNLLLTEAFTEKKVPVISTMGRIVCQWKIPELKNSNLTKDSYPAKPHRILFSSFQEELTNPENQLIKYRIQMKSGLFDNNDESLLAQEKFEKFSPSDVVRKVVEKALPNLHNLTEKSFKIIARNGSWIYLNRGRAFGLSIGTRLQGPNGAKLHVIKYVPNYKGELDVSIAFLRHEKKDSPLNLGDNIEIDKAQYPVLKDDKVQ